MRSATWMLLGLGGAVGTASGQSLSFTTVMDSRSPVAPAGGSQGTLSYVGQVVLQEDNSVAAIVKFGPLSGAGPDDAVTYHPTPGNAAAMILAIEGDAHADFRPSLPGAFDDFYNLAAVNGAVTFAGDSAGDRGIFRYVYDSPTPQKSTIHFDGDTVSGSTGVLDTGLGLPAYGVNEAGHVVFSAQTVLPTPGTQFVARFDGVSSTRIHDASGGIEDFNNDGDTPFPPHKTLTNAGHTVFVGDDVADNDGRRIYDIAPGGPSSPSVRIGPTLTNVTLQNGSTGTGTYEPRQLLAATGDAITGATLFRTFKDRTDSSDDGWQTGALLVKSTTGVHELGTFDLSTDGGTDVTGVMSDNGRVAAYVPDATGGHVVYYDAAAGGLPTTIAGFGTNVGGPFSIKEISLDDVSVPMVNDRGTIVFDAVITDGASDFQALLAWTVGSTSPFVVVKTGDTVNIGGQPETVGMFGITLMPIGPHIVGDLGYDGDVLKDGLNDDDFLAFGVWYDQDNDGFPGDGAAILLTQLPEPGALVLVPLAGAALLRRRTRPTVR